MQVLGLLLPLLGLVAFAAFIWLLVVAFRESALWGVLVLLFSPITAIIFAIRYWDEARKPFLAYVGSSAAGIAVVMIMIAFVGAPMLQMAAEMSEAAASGETAAALLDETTDPMEPMEPPGTPEDSERDELDRTRGTLSGAPEQVTGERTDGDAAASIVDRLAQEEQLSISGYESDAVSTTRITKRDRRSAIPLREIERHVGEKLRVMTTGGSEFVGRYVGRRGGDLEFQRQISAGTIAVYFPRSDVKSLHRVPRH